MSGRQQHAEGPDRRVRSFFDDGNVDPAVVVFIYIGYTTKLLSRRSLSTYVAQWS